MLLVSAMIVGNSLILSLFPQKGLAKHPDGARINPFVSRSSSGLIDPDGFQY